MKLKLLLGTNGFIMYLLWTVIIVVVTLFAILVYS